MSEAHGDEHLTIDLEPYLENALDVVIETIFDNGQYPAKRPGRRFQGTASYVPKQFDLFDFVAERVDEADIIETFVAMLMESTHQIVYTQDKWQRRVAAMLAKHLEGSEIVQEAAEKLAEEDRP